MRSVAVYSDADRHALHVREADESIRLGPAPAAESYLRAGRIARPRRATAAPRPIHPGYGFLSENAEFAEAVRSRGHRLHRTHARLRSGISGSKHRARDAGRRRTACRCCPAAACSRDLEEARARSGAHRLSRHAEEHCRRRRHRHAARPPANPNWRRRFDARRAARRKNFGDGGVFLEKYVEHGPPHRGADIRRRRADASSRSASAIARRSGAIKKSSRRRPRRDLSRCRAQRTARAAVRLGRAVSYRSAGTVEFVLRRADAASSIFSRSTRACRSSTASPRR